MSKITKNDLKLFRPAYESNCKSKILSNRFDGELHAMSTENSIVLHRLKDSMENGSHYNCRKGASRICFPHQNAGKYILHSSNEFKVCQLDYEKKTYINYFPLHTSAISSINTSVDPDKSTIFVSSGSISDNVMLADTRSKTFTIVTSIKIKSFADFRPESYEIAVGNANNILSFYDMRYLGTPSKCFEFQHDPWISIKCSRESDVIFATSSKSHYLLPGYPKKTPIFTFKNFFEDIEGCILPGSDFVMSGSNGGVQFWNFNNGAKVLKLEQEKEVVTSAIFHPSLMLFATTSYTNNQNRLKFWIEED